MIERLRLLGLRRKMARDWDRRARENAEFYIVNLRTDWSEDDFFRSGEQSVAELISTDMINICQGKDPKRMRVLEIGCGAGRVTRALAQLSGEVHGVDVSAEMVRKASRALSALPNTHVYRNHGMDLDVVGHLTFDFAFSMCVFHHISSREIIESYLRGVHQLLVPGGLFKFEVQGCTAVVPSPGDSWIGAPFSEEEAVEMALRCGFQPRYRVGAGEERFWLWFFKPQP